MKTQSLLLLPLLVSFPVSNGVSGSDAVSDQKPPALGGWQPIKDVEDPHVQELARFVITQHNKEANTNLKFQKVVRGETQVVAGTKYRLIVAANDGHATNNYEAVVWEKPWEISGRTLTSFKHV
ncbi:PREDICTED: cysteine proteinase inhibitor 1-like [Nelumbo nucifera]|uniref:Cysteine proteinase inhibitor 1-like n=2 Tax=Nelumbo nucifera TaxID=4432 RepID=A0A1U7ZQP0_NELNU|nr:PREDICTED: cysteine proteinase inhibitor 1-like [Nelumbo nucifera]DAD39253.1 TPA_asm: hypothetical protein HUJ06_013576 [Nelumbo nucifera]